MVEDIINRRHTVLKVMSRIRELGGEVIGVSAVVTLPDVSAENLGTLQFERMGEISYQAWPPDQCVREGPCSRSEPVVVDPGLGHGAEFAAEHPDYAGGFVTLLV